MPRYPGSRRSPVAAATCRRAGACRHECRQRSHQQAHGNLSIAPSAIYRLHRHSVNAPLRAHVTRAPDGALSKVSVNGIELAFEEIGSGSRALLLIHGRPFDHTMWQPQFGPIARLGWHVIAPDLRGYGASDIDGEMTTLDIFARDQIALLDHLG